MRSAGAVLESLDAFGEEPVTPLAHRLGVDLEALRGLLDRPTVIQHTPNHPSSTLRSERRVWMLTSSVGHEPSRRDVSCPDPQPRRRAHLTSGSTNTIHPGTTS